MSSPEKDNFGNWCKFAFGCFLLWVGASRLFQFVAYGHTSFGPSSRFPLELTGESAALVHILYVSLGVVIGISGIKGLLSK
jgi:hypothetical protein